jgi:hypothetical protein
MRLWSVVMVAFGVLLSASAAYACSTASGKSPTLEEQFAAASSVFTAHVVRVEETTEKRRDPKEAVLAATFRIIEVLKGKPPSDNKVKSYVYGPGNCTVPVLAGTDYIFFLEENSAFVDWPGGTQAFFDIDAAEAKELLGRLRAPKN